jgi:hypothetical protein
MRKTGVLLTRFYKKLQRTNDRVMGVVATILFSFIYIFILPWFAVFAKQSSHGKKKGWVPWGYKSDTLEDMRKQY